jgi:hypothetical protein
MATGIQISPPSDITVGTTAISNGTEGRVLFQGAGNVIQQDAGLFWDNTNKRLGVGTSTPAYKLSIRGVSGDHLELINSANNKSWRFNVNTNDFFITETAVGNPFIIKAGGNVLINTTTDAGFRLNVNGTARFGATTVIAPGALSTDLAFRVRNSADSADLLNIKGDNTATISRLAISLVSNVPYLHYIDTTQAVGSSMGMGSTSINFRHANSNIFAILSNKSTIHYNGAPLTGVSNGFETYSADIVAGNAAPHFRTEAGDVVKLYKETTASLGTGATFTNGTGAVITEDATFGGLTLAQIAKALGNLGLVELTA